MKATHLAKYLGVALLGIVLLAGVVKVYRRLRDKENAENAQLEEDKKWAIGLVQRSATGSRSVMEMVSREFVGEAVKLGTCEWHVRPMWNGSFNNPNWFSRTKGIAAYSVECTITIGSSTCHPDEMEFVWEVSTEGEGVKSLRWSWHYEPPEY